MPEFDEFGRPKYPGYVPPEDPMLQLLDQQTAPAAPEPMDVASPHIYGGARARSTNPILAENGINTEGPLADQAAQNADDYRSQQSDYVSATGQLPPQQYGVAQEYQGEEGPLSPQETAARMPQTTSGMNELIRKHMLPSVTPKQQAGYDQYVAQSRMKRDAEKARLREQGALNRADRREKDADTWNQMSALNGLQGRPMGMEPNGGSMGFSGGPSVQNIGGFNFVKGHWRPMTPEEQAKVRLINANANYANARPEIEEAKLEGRAALLNASQRFAAEQNQLKADARKKQDELANDLRKQQIDATNERTQARTDKDQQNLAYQARTRFDDLVRQVRETEGRAYDRFGKEGGSVQDYYDQFPNPDRKSKEKFVKKPGAYNSSIDELLKLNETLADLWDKGYKTGDIPPDVLEMIQRLKYLRGRAESPVQ